jgi:hypothetical protein
MIRRVLGGRQNSIELISKNKSGSVPDFHSAKWPLAATSLRTLSVAGNYVQKGQFAPYPRPRELAFLCVLCSVLT